MKMSPVQLVESNLIRISVTPNKAEVPESGEVDGHSDIGLEHLSQISKYPHHDDSDKSLTYLVMLGVRSSPENNTFAYDFEVLVSARIALDVDAFSADMIDDNAARYGFTMLYGQVREAVTSLTMRMTRDVLILPTMSFMDETFEESRFDSSES